MAIYFSMRKRRTKKLRTQFGAVEYARTVEEGGGQRKAEAALDKRAERVEAMHIRPLGLVIVRGLSNPGTKSSHGSLTAPEAQ